MEMSGMGEGGVGGFGLLLGVYFRLKVIIMFL